MPQTLGFHTVIVLENQQGSPCIFLHVVHESRCNLVDSVLNGLAAVQKRLLTGIELKWNEGELLPRAVKGLLFLHLAHYDLEVRLIRVLHIRNEHVAIKDIVLNKPFLGVVVELLPDTLLKALIALHGVQPAESVKLGMLFVLPERNDFPCSEVLPAEITLSVVVRHKIADTAVYRVGHYGSECPHELPVQVLFQLLVVLVRVGSDGERLACQVIHLLCNRVGVLIVDYAVVRQVGKVGSCSVLVNELPFLPENVVLALIVVICSHDLLVVW